MYNPNLYYAKSKILDEIDSGTLEKKISNCKSLKKLSKYFNITTVVKQYFINNKIDVNFLLDKIDEIKSLKQLIETLNLDYWCKKNQCKSDVDGIKNNFKIEIKSGDFLEKTLQKIESLEDLALYFNLKNEELFFDLVKIIKNDIINDINSGSLRSMVSKADVSEEELAQVFDTVYWFELRCFSQEIVDYDAEIFDAKDKETGEVCCTKLEIDKETGEFNFNYDQEIHCSATKNEEVGNNNNNNNNNNNKDDNNDNDDKMKKKKHNEDEEEEEEIKEEERKEKEEEKENENGRKRKKMRRK